MEWQYPSIQLLHTFKVFNSHFSNPNKRTGINSTKKQPLKSSFTSNRWGPCTLQLQTATEKRTVFSINTPDWNLNCQTLLEEDGQIEWGWLTTTASDQLLITCEGHPYLCFSLIHNSAAIHITGNGEMVVHETGFQLIYSPYLSFTIKLEEGQTYCWMILRFTEAIFNEIVERTHTPNVPANFLHPRFLLTAPRIWPSDRWHQLLFHIPHSTIYPFLYQIPPTVAMQTLKDTLYTLPSLSSQARFISLDIARHVYQQKNNLLDQCHQHLLIDELLDEAGITNKAYFRKCIAGLFGCSVAELINQHRIQYAATLLQQKDLAIKEIAVRVGFANVFHFTKLFTRQYGLPPKRYQRQFGF